MAPSTTEKRAKLAGDLADRDPKSADRDSPIDKVQHGEMTPEQAGVDAERRGVGKSAAVPDPEISPWQGHRVTDCQLPELIKPEGPGYMPLYCAAQWIATRGGTLEIHPSDLSVWQDAFAQLLARIASDEVTATGMREGQREKLEGHIFAGILVDFPFHDTPFNLLVSEELYLWSRAYIDEEHWQKDWNDVLETRHGAKWSKLMVLKSNVGRYWPFGLSQDTMKDPSQIHHTGAPGRPSSMHLVEAEYRARWHRGEAEASIGAEAKTLAEWLQNKHPDVPRLKPKSIANRLRREHRERIANAQN
jgi:hypothetical protein